ncbi:MAG: site-specific integrase [Desulfofustis sp.]|jgi:integrase|nr:site-specific integrase [Desulfofustis sp.]
MATITKTPSGTWKATIRRRGWPTQAKTFRLKKDAEDWGRRTEDEMIRGVYIARAPGERMTVAAALNRYLVEVTPTKRPTTQAREPGRARQLIASLGDYAMAAITQEIVARYRDERLAEGKSNNTVRLELALLGHLYTVAIKEWGMGGLTNPVSQIRKPSPGAGRNRRLTGDEQARLLAACRKHSNPKLAWIVELAIETAMRAGEIESLRRGQVDLNRRIIRLDETKNGTARTVPLTRRAVEVLREVLDDVRPIDTDLLFWGELGQRKADGKRTRKPYVWRVSWAEALERAGIEGLHFHDLRHEAVSRLVESGLGDQQVAAISGHKSMQMLRRYTHLRAEDLVEVLDQIGERRGSKK